MRRFPNRALADVVKLLEKAEAEMAEVTWVDPKSGKPYHRLCSVDRLSRGQAKALRVLVNYLSASRSQE